MVNKDSSGDAVWRPLAVVAGLVATAAAVLLYANRELAGDLFWLLAAGRYVDAHGAGLRDPFLTIAHGRHWYNQQWLSEWLLFQVQRAGGVKLVSFAYALVLGATVARLAWGCRGRRLVLVLVAFALFVGSAVCVLQPRAAGSRSCSARSSSSSGPPSVCSSRARRGCRCSPSPWS